MNILETAKKTRGRAIIAFALMLCLHAGSVTGCTENKTPDTDDSWGASSDSLQSETAAAENTESEDDYLINGFDVRTISDSPEIEAAIRQSANVETGELTIDDFLSVTSLSIYDADIEDITPLKALINLTDLYVAKTGVADISPLSELKNLTILYLINNKIVDVSPLSDLENLTILFLINNEIVDISPLSALENLSQLNLDGNSISDLSPLSGLTNLYWLSLERNEIVDVSPLAGLNVTDLRLCSNKLSDITPLGELKKIQRLCFSFNPVNDISALRNATTLLQLYAVNCPIDDFSPVDHVICLESSTVCR